jgi:transcriptional regulator with PAS, ATPase and Fis domain
LHERYRFGSIIGRSAAMQRVYELILNAAATDVNVIIYGESGTGKELVARAIHSTLLFFMAGCQRRSAPGLPDKH